ncbi:hypothetical protein AKJ09_03851 [Labilithrix luteola]|uniref:Uncharacterized protein n=1 Tax=Labilithrix luteola TaxID=1391654 RepID=A0A0K1PUI6_9BACT|nr:hypothetical protein AKJ09_03851 [Labilithrix luteola]
MTDLEGFARFLPPFGGLFGEATQKVAATKKKMVRAIEFM